MRLPKVGERWIVTPCGAHHNSPGSYIWRPPPIFDSRIEETVSRVRCGCVFPDDVGGAAVTAKEEAKAST